MIEIIKEYMELTGLLYIEISQKTIYKGVKIGLWINNRRKDYKQGKLTKEEEMILRSLGEVFIKLYKIPTLNM